ncbi:B3 domain-containing protein Os03g0164300-like [Aegilops tauschii subsp. strangulata]|uniref:B3 domain-containing protein Os03g0164300-like n=1 Tax=Aegilops tauschii subsp. strangulata TaxID=200361 RepID=UPI001ABCC8E2|nr:B3 domain-containing protein Os12g0591400-like [Aegilops tauschii subsp. strangulata]
MAHMDTSSLGPEENGDNSEGASETSFILPKKPSLTPAQEQKLLEKVEAIDPRVPLYVVILDRTNACRGLLTFGTNYASRYLNKNPAAGKKSVISLVLQLEGESRTWDTELQRKTDHTAIVEGWASFAGGNRLQEGDICLFKLMESEEPLKMMVYIIRAEECT